MSMLGEVVRRDRFPDVELRATCADGGQTTVRVHRMVLAAIPYFRCLFERSRPTAVAHDDAGTDHWLVYELEVPLAGETLAYMVDSLYGRRDLDGADPGDVLRACLFLALPERHLRRHLESVLTHVLGTDADNPDGVLPAFLASLADGDLPAPAKAAVLARTVGLLEDDVRRSLCLEERGLASDDYYRPRPSATPDGLLIGSTLSPDNRQVLECDGLVFKAYCREVADGGHYWWSLCLQCRTGLVTPAASPRTARVALTIYDPVQGLRVKKICRDVDDDSGNDADASDDATASDVVLFPRPCGKPYSYWFSPRDTSDLVAYQFRVRFTAR